MGSRLQHSRSRPWGRVAFSSYTLSCTSEKWQLSFCCPPPLRNTAVISSFRHKSAWNPRKGNQRLQPAQVFLMYSPNDSSRLHSNTFTSSSSNHLGTQINPGMTPDRAFGCHTWICLGLVPFLGSSALSRLRCLPFCECPFPLTSLASSRYCIKSQAFHDPLNYLAWMESQNFSSSDRKGQTTAVPRGQQSRIQTPGFSPRPGLAPSQLRQSPSSPLP